MDNNRVNRTDLLCRIYWTVCHSDHIFPLTLWAAAPGDSSLLCLCSPGPGGRRPASWPSRSPSVRSGSPVSCDCEPQTCERETWVCSPSTEYRRHWGCCRVQAQTALCSGQNTRGTLWSSSRSAPVPESPAPCCSAGGTSRRRWARCTGAPRPSAWWAHRTARRMAGCPPLWGSPAGPRCNVSSRCVGRHTPSWSAATRSLSGRCWGSAAGTGASHRRPRSTRWARAPGPSRTSPSSGRTGWRGARTWPGASERAERAPTRRVFRLFCTEGLGSSARRTRPVRPGSALSLGGTAAEFVEVRDEAGSWRPPCLFRWLEKTAVEKSKRKHKLTYRIRGPQHPATSSITRISMSLEKLPSASIQKTEGSQTHIGCSCPEIRLKSTTVTHCYSQSRAVRCTISGFCVVLRTPKCARNTAYLRRLARSVSPLNVWASLSLSVCLCLVQSLNPGQECDWLPGLALPCVSCSSLCSMAAAH